MPQYRTELFGQFIYSPEISYEDLLVLEEELKAFSTATLEEHGASFIHFESEGDHTFIQCVFSEKDDDLFMNVCKSFAARTSEQIECKLFFVDKRLSGAHFYAINNGYVSDTYIKLPLAGPVDEMLSIEN